MREGPWAGLLTARVTSPRGGVTVPGVTVKVRSHGSGHILSGEGSRLRSRPVRVLTWLS